MMAVEGPFLAAVIARLADAKFNLAAYGVAYSFALLVEAPVIMLMSASTALVEDTVSFRRLRVFSYVLCLGTTGALLIVLWCAVMLHARWSGWARERGLMNMAIFGNVITAFSWFGVNMLGIGLHSYGFMDAAFKWLMLFNGSQICLILLGLLPLRWWRSFQAHGDSTEPPSDSPGGTAASTLSAAT